MTNDKNNQQYKSGPICNGPQSIIWAWALDAPKLDLPRGYLSIKSIKSLNWNRKFRRLFFKIMKIPLLGSVKTQK
jgi:hypothetical protein